MLGSRELGGTGEWFLVVLKYLRYTYLTLLPPVRFVAPTTKVRYLTSLSCVYRPLDTFLAGFTRLLPFLVTLGILFKSR